MVLWFLNNPRINLSPFTKDFRVEEQIDESMTLFLQSLVVRPGYI